MEDRKEPTLNDLFSFDKREVTRYMMFTMRLDKKFKSAFNYLMTKMKVRKLPCDFNRISWEKGKSYDWAAFKIKNVELIIRKYQQHFTFFVKHTKQTREDRNIIFTNVRYGCFTYQVNTEMLTGNESDSYWDNPFQDLQKRILSIIDEIEEGHIHGLWNPYSATIDTDTKKNDSYYRPDHIVIKNIWDGYEDISNIDDFIFACEELFQKYLEKFATIDMIKQIKKLKVGDKIGGKYEVLNIAAKVKDNEYYHDVGLELKGTNGNEERWYDVYALTRWYLNDVFNREVPLFTKTKKRKDKKVEFDMNDY